MQMNYLKRKLYKIFREKFILQPAFEEAQKDKQGNGIIKKSKIISISGMIFSSIFIIGSILVREDFNDNFELLVLLVTMSIIFLILSLVAVTSKVIYNTEGVTSHRLGFKRHLDYNSITSVNYSRIFGGSIVLKGVGIKIIVTFENKGFIDFFQVLKNHFGDEKVKDIEIKLKAWRNQ